VGLKLSTTDKASAMALIMTAAVTRATLVVDTFDIGGLTYGIYCHWRVS
ncbi:hypothetical protein LCGC14_2618090, partial [marine sediment metagenome]